jgi:hypothetical protein
MATCLTRIKLSCVPTINAPGSALTTQQLSSCASAIAKPSCDDVLARNIPDECKAQAGSLADGVACADDSQCSNKKCKKQKNATCGVCSSPAAAGGACQIDENCDYGLQCAPNGICVAAGDGGATCDVNHMCKSSFVCRGGTCAQAPAEGATCDPAAQDCSLAKGTYCDPGSKVCKKVLTVNGGATCGLATDGFTVCNASARCKLSGAQGTCLSAAPDGQACDVDKGPDCTPPARCDGSVCKIADPAACK